MDALVANRERGYVCAAPVHALMVAHDDPEMLEALQRRDARRARRHAARVGRQRCSARTSTTASTAPS